MSAKILPFEPRPANPGNGAREALFEIWRDQLDIRDDEPLTLSFMDWMLAELWLRGYKVVPVEASDEAPHS